RILDARLLTGRLAHRDLVTGFQQHRRDVDDSPIDLDCTMRDELPCLGTRRSESHAIDDVVQARFEQSDQVRAGVAAATRGFGEIAAELALENAVHALDFLLLAQLYAVVGEARTRHATVLSRLAVRLALGVKRAPGA